MNATVAIQMHKKIASEKAFLRQPPVVFPELLAPSCLRVDDTFGFLGLEVHDFLAPVVFWTSIDFVDSLFYNIDIGIGPNN